MDNDGDPGAILVYMLIAILIWLAILAWWW
jgi:hypothetical protein